MQMFHSLQFEQLTIPVVLGLLCRTHEKIAVLLKSLHLSRNNPILHLSIVYYAIPKISIVYLSSISVIWIVWYSTNTEFVNVGLFPGASSVPLHSAMRKCDLNTGFIRSLSPLIRKH